MRKHTLAILAIAICVPTWILAQDSKPESAAVVESGKWRLHKFEQPIGDEAYTIVKDGTDLVITSKFKFVDRGSPVILNTMLRTSADLTPRSFKSKGNVSRFSTVDDEVTIEGGKAKIREGKTSREVDVGETFFTMTGYSPVVLQQEMARYLASHHVTGPLETIPAGDVTVESRGRDTVDAGAGKVDLDRFAVTGLIWGRETFWLDSNKRLVALVSIDAEFDHFEAVVDELEGALPTFVSRAAEDAMASLATLAAANGPGAAGTLAITGGTLIDGTGAAPVVPATVIIAQGHIVAAGSAATVAIPAGATIVDAKGKFVLPGLWDMHAHFEQVEWGPIYLAAGVTTVRDCGNEFDFIKTVRDVIARGEGIGPRLLLAGIVDGNGPMALGIVRANNADEAREVVKKYHDAGFHQIKIYSSVKKSVVAAICAEAHKAGMTVTGHIPNGMTLFDGIEAGMDMVNHVQYLDDVMKPARKAESGPAAADPAADGSEKALAALKEHHTVVDPTLVVFEWMMHPAATPFSKFEPGIEKVARELYANLNNSGIPASVADRYQAKFERYVAVVGTLHRAGIPIVVGTDQVVPGHSVYREIELYVKAGFTPMEAIQAATIVPARVMKLDKESGTVEAGKIADVIILDGDPLASISAIRSVRTVITAGRLFDCSPLWTSVGFKP